MNTYQRAIEEIAKLKEALERIEPKVAKRVVSRLVGEIGELHVLSKLEGLGFTVEQRGGQAGFDMKITDYNKRIEVRTSLLKNEGQYPENIRFFGWRVKNRNDGREDKFDIMIGVALDKTFKEAKFYVFTREEAFSVGDVERGQFRNVQKKIHLFENEAAYEEALNSKSAGIVTPYERYINEHQPEFLSMWDKIKENHA